MNGQKYHLSKQWIQSQEVLYFGDSYTVNLILKVDTPYQYKRLGYQINGYDHTHWRNEGYELIQDGIREKFTQNPALFKFLKSTTPKTLIEVSTDKTWETIICYLPSLI